MSVKRNVTVPLGNDVIVESVSATVNAFALGLQEYLAFCEDDHSECWRQLQEEPDAVERLRYEVYQHLMNTPAYVTQLTVKIYSYDAVDGDLTSGQVMWF